MNRLFSMFLGAALAALFFIGCGRSEEAPAPKVEAPKILTMAEGEVRAGVVYAKVTGKPFTGTLREHWPSGKLRRETGMKAGLRHGEMKGFTEAGVHESNGQFVEGKPHGEFWKLTVDGLQLMVTAYEMGRETTRTIKPSPKMKSRVAELNAANEKLNATVWKPEEQSQRREQTFVKLWDDLRAAKHDWKPLEDFAFQTLRLGELGKATRLERAIDHRGLGPPTRTLDRQQWRQWIAAWRAGSLRLVETEWHQASYDPAKDESLFKVSGHLIDEKANTRHIVRLDLRVGWAKNAEPQNALYAVDAFTVEALTLLSRQGDAPFVTKQIIDVLGDNPDVDPGETDIINLWGRVYPPSLVLQDLNGDHLPEVITGGGNLIYWNRGNFKLEPGLLVEGNNGFNHAIVLADFTGDGHADLFTLNPRKHPEVIPGNGRGDFTPRPRGELASPLPNGATMDNISCHAVGDIDGDGDLDVYACQYESAFKAGATPQPYHDALDGHPAYLLLNDGTGKFTDATEAAGLAAKRKRRTYSASLVDLDNDRDLDLLVVSDFAGMDLYRNDGKGKFTDVTAQLGDHRFSFGMSHSLADFNGDGHLDIYMVGMGSTTARRLDGMNLRRVGFKTVQDARTAMGYGNRLFLGDGKGNYTQAKYNDRVARSGWSWGSTPWDFDLDGDRDLFVANGHLSGKSCQDYCTHYWRRWVFPNEAKELPLMNTLIQGSMQKLTDGEISWNGFEHNVLFMNQGNGQYLNIAFLMGISHESDCRSVVSGDLDADGRPDLLVVEGRRRKGDQQREGYIQVIQNLLTTGNHWIGVHLKGQPIGAVVSVFQGKKIQKLPIVTGDSFDAQHPNTAHFGLGKNGTVDALEVRWPNGKISRLEKPKIDHYHVMGLD